MAGLRHRAKVALEESRMLVLGIQVLLGFEFRAAFEKGFDLLPPPARYLKLVGLALQLAIFTLLLLPVAYHHLVEGGVVTSRLPRVASRVMDIALFPFAAVLALDLGVATVRLVGAPAAIGLGLADGVIALFFWYGIEALQRSREEPGMGHEDAAETTDTKLEDRVEQVLIEVRIVLPGAQALLGFQLASYLTEGFEKLPFASRYVHLASLLAIAMATVLLMAPAAYHRIAERGEETERLPGVAARFLLGAMACLALGLAGDLYVVVAKVTGGVGSAAVAALLALTACYGLWFGLTTALRARGEAKRRPAPPGKPVRAGD